jgi:hypothetical protein
MQIHIHQAGNNSNVLSISELLNDRLGHISNEIDPLRMDFSFLMLLAGNDYLPGLYRVSFQKILKNFGVWRTGFNYRLFEEGKGYFSCMDTTSLTSFLSTLLKKNELPSKVPLKVVKEYWEGLIWHYGIHRGWIIPHEPHHYFMPLLPYSYKRSLATTTLLPKGPSKPITPMMLLKFIEDDLEGRFLDLEREVRQLDSKWRNEFHELCQGSSVKPSPELSSLLVSLFCFQNCCANLILPN